MQRVNEFNFYELATLIHPLTEVSNEVILSQVWMDWLSAKELLNRTFVERRPLAVCRPAAENLYRALRDFVPDDWERYKRNSQNKINPILS